MHSAACVDQCEVLELLLQKGLKVDTQDVSSLVPVPGGNDRSNVLYSLTSCGNCSTKDIQPCIGQSKITLPTR